MLILQQEISANDLNQMAAKGFGDMVKAVVDIERGLLAVDAQLHSDLEALLLQNGSKQTNLWGINLYPEISGDDFVEYDSMINLRPSAGNRTRGVESETVRAAIVKVVAKWVRR